MMETDTLTGMGTSAPSAPIAKEDPETLVLRGRLEPVVRFKRGLIIGVAGSLAAGLVTLSWIALEPPSLKRAAVPMDAGERAMRPNTDVLAGTPQTYGEVPKLGPPLPGDLGRPILEHDRALDALTTGSGIARQAESGAMPERDRTAEQRRMAMQSPVIVSREQSSTADPNPPPVAKEAVAGVAEPAPGASPDGRRNAARLAAGTIIVANLITGLNSDLPGLVLAQVSEDVRDSVSGGHVLIPQGARLLGRYESNLAYGQRRAMLVWTRIVMPDGSSVVLDDTPATDARGFAGVTDSVDGHGWQLLKGVALATLLGTGTQLSLGATGSGIVRALGRSGQQSTADAGGGLIDRNLEVKPTVRVRPGWPVRAILSQDLILPPWGE